MRHWINWASVYEMLHPCIVMLILVMIHYVNNRNLVRFLYFVGR